MRYDLDSLVSLHVPPADWNSSYMLRVILDGLDMTDTCVHNNPFCESNHKHTFSLQTHQQHHSGWLRWRLGQLVIAPGSLDVDA